jgi:hypothetical protein
MPATIPDISFTPLATAIPRHNGIATRKTTIDAGKSAPILLKYFFIKKYFKQDNCF